MGVFVGMITDKTCTIIHGMVLNYVPRLRYYSHSMISHGT